VITFLICAYESSLFFNAFGNLSSSRIRTNFLPLGAEFEENPHSGIINTVSLKKPFTPKEKTPVVWYSHQCTPASHHSRCTSTANKIALRCSANPLIHTSIISLSLVFLLQKKPPKPWRTRGKHHARRTASHQRSEPSDSNIFFSSLLLILIAIS
jgi:hypothetical protein